MTVTSGFFNSMNGDRKYNAEQMSTLFDGIISDGVFENIGEKFAVKVSEADQTSVLVHSGRAWFGGIWINNDAPISISCGQAEVVTSRIDAIIIEVDKSDSVRAGTVKLLSGTPSSSPEKPIMVNNETLSQHPIAYIYRNAGTTGITQANIENAVGTEACPYITAILQTTNIDNMVAQWNAEWQEWGRDNKSSFEAWFNALQAILDSDTATKVSNAMVVLNDRMNSLASNHTVGTMVFDSTGALVEDSAGGSLIGGTTKFLTPGDDALGRWYHGTLTTTAWEERDSGSWYLQRISVPGMRTNLALSPIYCAAAATQETNLILQEELNKIATGGISLRDDTVNLAVIAGHIPTCDLDLYWWGVKE